MEPCDQTLVEDEGKTLPFVMDHLPEKFQQKALEELNETPENRIEGLSELKLLAKDDRSTSGIDFHEDFLLQFLRQGKYNVRKSFQRLRAFVELRRNYSHLFQSVDQEDLVTKESCKYVTILPGRCPDGCTVMLTQLGKFNPDEICFEVLERIIIALVLQPLRDPMTQINGFKFIHDFKETSVRHLRFCTPQNLKFLLHASLECIPGRYKQVHIVNQSVVFKTIWTLIKHLMPHKIRSRVYFHSDPSELLHFFPRSVLPVEYGGDVNDYYMTDYIKEATKMYGECTMEGQANYF